MNTYLSIRKYSTPQHFHIGPVSYTQNAMMSLNNHVCEKSRFVYKAQILTSGSSQGHKLLKTKTKTIRSRYPSGIKNILASRNKQDSILIDSHFKSVLHALYLISHVLYNRGVVYVVGYKTQILIPLSFYDKSGVLAESQGPPVDNALSTGDYGISRDCFFKLLKIEQENWCVSSLSNWQEKSEQLWRTACFITYLEEFALKNNMDFSQFRLRSNTQKKLSLLNQIITVETGNQQQSFMPFLRQPDLLIVFDAESKRSVLKQAKSLQIPTITITNSNMDTSDTLYSLPGNHKSIHLLYRFLDCFSLLSKKRY